ncbi:hypothetical protein JOB18_013764 [Solea senegalensis]|uniref:Uncharacterized protein n=1 Tax=Solea senegalensis TaxID=28829 RepID=A0AAV6PGU1_SOLSE|nr:hypothetical protein JOB18_013764 [Solea senegalensis]
MSAFNGPAEVQVLCLKRVRGAERRNSVYIMKKEEEMNGATLLRHHTSHCMST